jgi:hypothetical protein
MLLKFIQTVTEILDSELTQTFEEVVWRIGDVEMMTIQIRKSLPAD